MELLGRRFYRIDDYDRMAPFFMTVVSAGDPWLFVSSTGGVTAGRVPPDFALFPYYTDDKVAESAGRTGGLSLLRVGRGEQSVVWEPFTAGPGRRDPAQRALYKDVAGTSLVFEETRADLGLRMRVTWETGGRFGIVRTSELTNVGDRACESSSSTVSSTCCRPGSTSTPQNRLSNLLDAYKRTELDPRTGLGHVLVELPARPTSPSRASRCRERRLARRACRTSTTCCRRARCRQFRLGGDVQAEQDVRGERGAYLVHAAMALAPDEQRTWRVVGDVAQDAAKVVGLRELLLRPAEAWRPARGGPAREPGRAGADRRLVRRPAAHRRRAGHRPPLRQRGVQRHAWRHPRRRLPHRGSGLPGVPGRAEPARPPSGCPRRGQTCPSS